PFQVSLHTSEMDALGHRLGGTELINLVSHEGKLYAGNGYWMDPAEGSPGSAPQVLVLDSPTAAWREEHAFAAVDASGDLVFGRLTALAALTFTTDGTGAPLPAPVTMLFAGLERRRTGTSGAVFARSEDGTWTELDLTLPPPLSVRAL